MFKLKRNYKVILMYFIALIAFHFSLFLVKDACAEASSKFINVEPKAIINDGQKVSTVRTLLKYVEIGILESIKKSGFNLKIPDHEMSSSTSDYAISIKLGGAVTGAICSAIYRDKNKFLKYAAVIHEYGEILGIEESILSKYTEISKSASEDEWENVIEIIYDLKEDIAVYLINEDMGDYAILATITAWLEGVHIVADSLDKNFEKETLKFIHEGGFVDFLVESLRSIDEELLNRAESKVFLAALPEIDEIIDKPASYSFTKSDAGKILKITLPLHKTIMR